VSLASHVSRLSQKALIKNGQIFSRPPPHFPSFSFFRQKGAPRPSPPPSGGAPGGPPGGPPSGGPPFVKKEQFLPRGCGGPRDRVSEGAAAAELVRGRPPAQFSPKIRASRSVETLQLAFIDSLALTRRFMRRFQVHELLSELHCRRQEVRAQESTRAR